MAFYQKQVRIKSATNGYIVSTKPYTEIVYKSLDEVLRFVKNHFERDNEEKPKRYYGDKKEKAD